MVRKRRRQQQSRFCLSLQNLRTFSRLPNGSMRKKLSAAQIFWIVLDGGLRQAKLQSWSWWLRASQQAVLARTSHRKNCLAPAEQSRMSANQAGGRVTLRKSAWRVTVVMVIVLCAVVFALMVMTVTSIGASDTRLAI